MKSSVPENMGGIKPIDTATNEEHPRRVDEKRSILRTVWRKANWMEHSEKELITSYVIID